MKINEIILLLSNGKMKTVKSTQVSKINPGLVEYYLIPFNGKGSSSYLCIESNPYMIFTKARMHLSLSIEYFSDGVPSTTVDMNDLDIETDDAVVLFNYLHSLIRYSVTNAYADTFVDDLIPSDIFIPIKEFSIELEKNGEVFYEKRVEGLYSPENIIESVIDDFYNPMINEFNLTYNSDYCMVIRNNHWKKVKRNKIEESDLIGIFGAYLKVIIFIEAHQYFNIGRTVFGIEVSLAIMDKTKYPNLYEYTSSELQEKMDIEILPLKNCHLWLHDSVSIIEFIDNIEVISDIFITTVSLYFKIVYPEKYAKMIIEPIWVLSMDLCSHIHPSEVVSLHNDTMITLADFLNGMEMVEHAFYTED